MIGQATLWWQARSQREQWLLGIMAILLFGVFAIYGLWRPLQSAELVAVERLERAIAVRGSVEGSLAALSQERSSASDSSTPLPDIIMSTASNIGFDLPRPNADGQGSVVIDLPSARAQALWSLIGLLDRQGVIVEAAQISPKSDSTLSVSLTLRKRAG